MTDPDGVVPLHALPYAEQLRRLRSMARRALARYALGPTRLALLQYENNAVWRVTDLEGARFVLRIGTGAGRTMAEQRSELHWLRALARDTELRVPEPILTADGALLIDVGGRAGDTADGDDRSDGDGTIAGASHPAALFRWMPGRPPAPGMATAQAECIGALAAGLHRHAAEFAPPADFTRPRWDWEALFGATSVPRDGQAMDALDAGRRAVLEATGHAVRAELERPDEAAPERGMFHGDLHRDNLLLHDGAAGVIDFDDCGWGYFMFDLASVLDSFRRRVARGPDDFRRLRDALLTGYARVRALPPALDDRLAAFGAMRDMVNVGFILRSRNPNVTGPGDVRLGMFIGQMEDYLRGGGLREPAR